MPKVRRKPARRPATNKSPRRQQEPMLKKSMEDISNKTAVRDTNVNNEVSAWNACQPDSKKDLDALTSDEWCWEWVSLFFARPLDHHI
jgi:hypothetical protein